MVSLVVEAAFVCLCLIAPFCRTAEQSGARQLGQLLLTIVLLGLGVTALAFARRGARLWEVAICLLLIGPIHLVAAGTERGLVWLPIAFGCGSLLVTVPLAWRNA